ncbi:adenylyltransferase/cytidyltransferase family protein [Nitrosopumilus sp.]|uniref:adenylyltransferase/cytidyltransferase family protein n=1 Tax=Nitrosopumilus sp. TaxID=2024843 RepID=UPI003B5BF531
MDSLKKTILSAIYVSKITKETVFQILNQKKIFSDEVNSKFEELVKENLIEQDKKTLTEKGRNSLKVVLAGGVFDIIHPGHIHTLKDAKALGDVLVVVVATDNTSVKMKKRRPLHDQEQRRELVNSLSMVDLCLVGQEEDIFKTVDLVRPQVIALGYDQTHQEKFIIDGCKRIKLDAKVARLESPIPESSSSKIQKEYGESIHGI